LGLSRTPAESVVRRTPSGKTIAEVTIEDIDIHREATTARIATEAARGRDPAWGARE
jgi:hypothetical protein